MYILQIVKKTFMEGALRRHPRFSALLLVAFLMICSLGLTFVSTINKAHANPARTNTIQFSSLTMFDGQRGWAFNDTSHHVFITHQGPEHWVDVTPALLKNPQNIVTTTYFFNATHGYIGLLQASNTLLLSTQDGGRTWRTTSFTIAGTNPGEVQILQVSFLDLQHGWLVFRRGQIQPGEFDFVIMSTTNGGKTWQTVVDTSQNPANLQRPYSASLRVTFVSPRNGWATGIWLSGDVYLYATHDGGKTWSKANIQPIKGANTIDFTQDYGPYWQNSQQATLFVQYDADKPHLTTYRTLDGGKSWMLGPSTPATSFNELATLSFLNAREGWSLGFDGTGRYAIHHTGNSGLKWEIFYPTGLLQANADQVALLDLTFINRTTGWSIIKDEQDNYRLFQTTTGGHTWYALHPVD